MRSGAGPAEVAERLVRVLPVVREAAPGRVEVPAGPPVATPPRRTGSRPASGRTRRARSAASVRLRPAEDVAIARFRARVSAFVNAKCSRCEYGTASPFLVTLGISDIRHEATPSANLAPREARTRTRKRYRIPESTFSTLPSVICMVSMDRPKAVANLVAPVRFISREPPSTDARAGT